jgi:alpha-galactosidase
LASSLVSQAIAGNNQAMGTRPKIAIVGAGSFSHGKRLIDDLLTVEAFAEGDLVLMGNNIPRLEIVGAYAKNAAGLLRPDVGVIITDKLGLAIDGADIVITIFNVGGYEAFDRDYAIARGYGLDVCIGDTAGPLGAFRALRNGTVMLGIAEDMKKACPGALLINYVNPMAPMVSIASSSGISCLGICGGIESTNDYVAEVLGLPRSELRTVFAGVNHLCWLLDMAGPGGDLYPRFRELMKDPESRGDEAVRFEILQQFGYFASESSGHISDFFPYFRRNAELRDRYCSGSGYSGASGAYHRLLSFIQKRIGNADYLEGQPPASIRSSDYAPAIVEAWISNGNCKIYGNVINSNGTGRPALPGLPSSACVEVSVEIKGREIIIPPGPKLPPTLAALCTPLALQHSLVSRAFLEQNPEMVFAAIAQDQLTSAILDLPEIRALTYSLFAANTEWLPQGLRGSPRPTVDAGIRPSRPSRFRGSPELDLIRNYERRQKNSGYTRNRD